MSIVLSEKQNLLAALTEAMAECDRGILGKLAHIALEGTWPSARKQL